MELKDLNPIQTVLDSEQGKNLTVPVTKSVGHFINDIFSLVFGNWSHELAEKSRIKHQKNIEDFKTHLYNDAMKIPEVNLVAPKESIIGSALEASKYYFEEDEIRTMFEKLIVNSMDNRKISKVHPSFTEIIKQLSPLDAQNLTLFRNVNTLPLAEFQIKKEAGSFIIVHTNVFLSNPDCTNIAIQGISISSLERLGLLSIDYDTYLSDKTFYEKFQTCTDYQLLENEVKHANEVNNKNDILKLKKGKAAITPLGKAFIDVCLSPLPQ